jgi:hypothetical protein
MATIGPTMIDPRNATYKSAFPMTFFLPLSRIMATFIIKAGANTYTTMIETIALAIVRTSIKPRGSPWQRSSCQGELLLYRSPGPISCRSHAPGVSSRH